MKILEKAPNWFDYTKEFFEHNVNELNEFVITVEQRDEYAYWDKVKHLPLPDRISHELAWAYLKFSRQSKIRKIPLLSKDNEQFGYWLPDTILKSISYIDKHAGGEILIGDAKIHKAEQKKYLINSLMEEAIASSMLEGAATTRKKAKEMLRSGRKPKDHAERMIFNNYKTISRIKNLIKQKLDDKLILELHKSMTIDTLDEPDECGRFRKYEDEPIYVKDNEQKILYEAPDSSRIPEMMNMLYTYANTTNEQQFTHPVIKAVNLHFYLSYIHPFMDGNGRTARALFYWYMLKHDYWMLEYLSISKIFLDSPSRYARAFLYTEIDDLDLTYFISFHLRVINIAISKLVYYIKSKQKQTKEAAQYLRKYPELNERQKALIKNAVENPDKIYTIAYHASVHNVTYESARKDLLDIEKNRFFIMNKKGREFIFIPEENLASKIAK